MRIGRGNRRKRAQCCFVLHKSYNTCPEIKSGTPQLKRATNRLSYDSQRYKGTYVSHEPDTSTSGKMKWSMKFVLKYHNRNLTEILLIRFITLCYFAWVNFRPWWWEQTVPLEYQNTYTGLHGSVFQTSDNFKSRKVEKTAYQESHILYS
jgi:hypothetical protein